MDDHPPLVRSFARLAFGTGSGVASTVYGTVVVMATLTVGYASQSHPWKLAELVWSSALVLWLAHLYAHGLSESIQHRKALRQIQLGAIARREIGILLAAALPGAALVAGALGVLDETAAIWLAMAIGMVTLGAEGVRYARMERLGPTTTLLAVALNLGLGAMVVALKVVLAH